LGVRFTVIKPSKTQGVPPMRSRVEKVTPWSFPLIRALVHSTQSSLALWKAAWEKKPSMLAKSSISSSVRELLSSVTISVDTEHTLPFLGTLRHSDTTTNNDPYSATFLDQNPKWGYITLTALAPK
jgi:hypothetical protein